MYLAVHDILKSLRLELSALFGSDNAEASAGQSVLSALRLLEAREAGGMTLLRTRIRALSTLLVRLEDLAPPDRHAHTDIARLKAALQDTCTVHDRDILETELSDAITAFEAICTRISGLAGMTSDRHKNFALAVSEWEAADRLMLIDIGKDDATASDNAITRARFETYLRDRFNETDLSVTAFEPLAGGYGKQTILADVRGMALDGALVVRRDPPTASVDNDCHRVANEFPVIRAAFDRGFPAPNALWLDTEHALLPGPDFIVMRKSPGRTGGNVFGATESLSDGMVQVLATAMARLHGLPPLNELGDLTESIRADTWSSNIRDCTERYIRGWRDLFLTNTHAPSPALSGLYGWLLDNIPDSNGRPALLHGDIGFHNMLIDDGKLSALVDWEFAHVGDPAEDLGYVKNSASNFRWDTFLDHYRAAGGPEIDLDRLHFFQIWGHVRNATASNLSMGKFQDGAVTDLKLAYVGHFHFPLFIKTAGDLIAAGPQAETVRISY